MAVLLPLGCCLNNAKLSSPCNLRLDSSHVHVQASNILIHKQGYIMLADLGVAAAQQRSISSRRGSMDGKLPPLRECSPAECNLQVDACTCWLAPHAGLQLLGAAWSLATGTRPYLPVASSNLQAAPRCAGHVLWPHVEAHAVQAASSGEPPAADPVSIPESPFQDTPDGLQSQQSPQQEPVSDAEPQVLWLTMHPLCCTAQLRSSFKSAPAQLALSMKPM